MATRERIRERRLDRMRLGQAVCDFVVLPSDDQIRVAIVPLTEAEYLQVLELVTVVRAQDDLAGAALKDRRQSQEILVRAIREPDDLTQRVYSDVDELMEDFQVTDVDEAIDRYNEMIYQSSPQADGIPPEEWVELKKVLSEINMNELSGRAWYALRRFLGEIMPQLLAANERGSTSTKSSTTTNDSEESTPTA